MKSESRLVCILAQDGTITRLKHNIAQAMVDRGVAHFTTKSRYKKALKDAEAGKIRKVR